MTEKIARTKRDLSARTHFQVISKLNKKITTTKGYWNIIVNIKHPSIKGKENKVKEVLENPDYIRLHPSKS